ncbi:MAG: hypothetical protein JRI79_11675 [Deltaproteobacteria bacterium]|nr:hypothetical protein [Deltaproteobacteria bacterium]MBW2301185.1 hypothetical protein [Deltaproteobacteria bacterium]
MDSISALKQIRQVLRIIYLKKTADELVGSLKNMMDICAGSPVVKEKMRKYHSIERDLT